MSSVNQQMLGEMNGILLQAMQTLNEKLMKHSPEPIVATALTPEVDVGKKRKQDGGEEKKKKKKTGPKSDSSWICFVKARSAEVKLQPGEKLMTILGAEWKAMSDCEKEPYVSAATAAAKALAN